MWFKLLTIAQTEIQFVGKLLTSKEMLLIDKKTPNQEADSKEKFIDLKVSAAGLDHWLSPSQDKPTKRKMVSNSQDSLSWQDTMYQCAVMTMVSSVKSTTKVLTYQKVSNNHLDKS